MQTAATEMLKTIRCPACGKLIGEVNGSYRLWCKKCKAWTVGSTESENQKVVYKEQ